MRRVSALVVVWLLRRFGRRRARREEAERAAAEQRGREERRTLGREVVATPRAELAVAGLLLAAAVAAAGFVVFYVVHPDTRLLGLCLGVALLLAGVAAATAGRRLVPQEQAAEPYHDFGDAEAQEDVEAIAESAGEGISRRRLLAGAAGAAGATVGVAALVPVASLGPSVGERVHETPWRAGRRVVDSAGRPVRPEEIAEGTMVLAFPEGASRSELGSAVTLLRFAPGDLRMAPERRAAAPGGVVAYSRICTHAGCAVSIYRSPLHPDTSPDHALVCPCHFSTFDPREAGRVVFGPAARPLPQLPLEVNAAGELVAAGGFLGAVGPSYSGIRKGGGAA